MGTFFRYRSVPEGMGAFRIIGTAKEYFPLSCTSFAEVSRTVFFGTFHSCIKRLRILTLGITGTSEESAEFHLFDNHVPAAMVTNGICYFRFCLTGFSILVLNKIHCIFTFRIIGTGNKFSVFTPFYYHRISALITDNVSRSFFPLDISHFLSGLFKIFLKRRVEIFQRFISGQFPFFDQIQFLFHGGGEFNIYYSSKIFHQEIINQCSKLSRMESALFQHCVIPVPNRA